MWGGLAPGTHPEWRVLFAKGQLQAVVLVPEGGTLAWEWQDGYVRFTVQVIRGYQLIQLEGAAVAAGAAAPSEEFHVKQ